MIRLVAFGIASVCLLFVASPGAFAQKKDEKNKGEANAATAQQYALLARYTEMSGEIQSASAKSITFRVEYSHPVKNEAANNKKDNNDKNTNNNKKKNLSPQQIALRKQLEQMRAANKFKMEKDYIDFELPLAENAPIRKLNLGVEYDDKGNFIERKPEAKGNLPGSPGRIDDLTPGADVKVYLTPPKAGANKPQIRMVIVVDEPPSLMKKKNK